MTSDEATIVVIDALERLAIPYMVVGSLSSNYYGIARSTIDADIVIEFGERSVAEIVAQLGAAFVLDPQMSFESVTGTTRHIIKIADIDFKFELFHLSDDPHDQERFRHRRRVDLVGRTVSIPTVEDVIVTKMRWTFLSKRSKDRNDVKDVIAVQRGNIDWDYVYRWCDQHGTRALLDEIRRETPII